MPSATYERSSSPDSEKLENIDAKSGKAPETRLKDSSSARAIFRNYVHADKKGAYNRASIQGMFDGVPPYTESELIAAGQRNRCNINFDESGDLLERSVANYVDLLQSVETIASGTTDFGEDDDLKLEYSLAIMEEFTTMIRSWPQYFSRYLLNATYFLSQGLSFAIFPDAIDWRFEVDRLGNVILPKDTLASVEELEIGFWRKKMLVHDLYAKIKDISSAETMGWDVAITRQAILKASNDSDARLGGADWERWETEAKNNDIFMSSKATTVNLVHCWVKEFGGEVSHYIFLEHGEVEGFLYKRTGEYEGMTNTLASFAFGIGTNGFFHSIRGLGYKIFPHIQVSNRMNCQLVDGSALASSLMLQPQNAEDLNKLAMTHMGPFTILAPGLKPIEKGVPNFSTNVIPVLDRIKEMARAKTQGYTSTEALPTGQEMSRFEASTRVQTSAGLTVTSMVLYYEQFDLLIREMARRAFKKKYNVNLPGGKFIKKMRDNLVKKGVPLEALYEFDIGSIFAVRAVGAGSSSARSETFRNLTDMAPGFDEVGRKNLQRDKVAHEMKSYNAADRYTPRVEKPRVPIDTKIAELENNQMRIGMDVEVKGNELHLSHLAEHVEVINEIIEGVEDGTQDLLEVTPFMVKVQGHATNHLELVSGDPIAEEDVAFYRQVLQQAGEIIMNGVRALEKVQREQGEAEGSESDPEADQANSKLRAEAAAHTQKLEHLQETHDLKQALQVSEAQTKRIIANADAAAKLDPTAQL